jgi:hypothetical protein
VRLEDAQVVGVGCIFRSGVVVGVPVGRVEAGVDSGCLEGLAEEKRGRRGRSHQILRSERRVWDRKSNH